MDYVGIHQKDEYTLSELLKTIKDRADFQKAGAIATFVGVVRGNSLDGENVEGLELQAYEEQANKVLGGIRDELMKRDGIVDVQIHHFVGEFSVGEDLVYVAVAGGHRNQVFDVLREAVERYKSEAPVFKKEHIIGDSGKESYWVSEREAQRKRKTK